MRHQFQNPTTGTAVTKMTSTTHVEARYIDQGKLRQLLENKFPKKDYSVRVSNELLIALRLKHVLRTFPQLQVGKWIITTPSALTKVRIHAEPTEHFVVVLSGV